MAFWFLNGHKTKFIKENSEADKKHIAQKFNFAKKYMVDDVSLQNSKISSFIDLV